MERNPIVHQLKKFGGTELKVVYFQNACSESIFKKWNIFSFLHVHMLLLMFSMQCLYEFISAFCFYVCAPQGAALTWPQKFQSP